MDKDAVAEFLRIPCRTTAEDLGLRIVFKHFRPIEGIYIKKPFHYRRGRERWPPTLRGGRTQCFIYDENRCLVAMGETVCHPNENFCYAEGRYWASDRAFDELAERLREKKDD